MPELKRCPCGEIPEHLCIEGPDYSKYAYVAGSCCGMWSVEFRNQYARIPGDEAMQRAVEAWNAAPRPSPPNV